MSNHGQLPNKIEKCPLKEALFELRFVPNVPGPAIFGILYPQLKSSFPAFETLPIVQLPEALRENDPNLLYQPHYRLRRDNLLVQIGPRILSVNVLEPYIGWNNFRREILAVLKATNSLEIVKEVTRFGIKYSNVFAEQILERINLEIFVNSKQVTNAETSIRTIIPMEDDFKVILQIAGGLTISPSNGQSYEGSMIDVDVVLSGENLPVLGDAEGFIEKAHEIEKKTFFLLLKKDFLETLEPSYE